MPTKMKPINEMTTEEKNREVAAWLGRCWHEYDSEIEDDGVARSFCTKCNADSSCSNFENPDFTTDALCELIIWVKRK